MGVIREGRRERPVAVVTADGGGSWKVVRLREKPASLFFLNESLGWMATEGGLWRTADSGATWTKLPKLPAPVRRVFFRDERKGWAACERKTALVTHDGGLHWTAIPAASAEPGTPETTAYSWIDFATPEYGLVIGANAPRRTNAGAQADGRETPHLTLMLKTLDGGARWTSESVSMFGEITRTRFGAPGSALALIEHLPVFPYPSDALRLDWPSGKSQIVYHDPSFFITDVWVAAGAYYLAGVETGSRLNALVPQRVRVLRSNDLRNWSAMEVDYRALANRVFLAAPKDGARLWLATNNGTFLSLDINK